MAEMQLAPLGVFSDFFQEMQKKKISLELKKVSFVSLQTAQELFLGCKTARCQNFLAFYFSFAHSLIPHSVLHSSGRRKAGIVPMEMLCVLRLVFFPGITKGA